MGYNNGPRKGVTKKPAFCLAAVLLATLLSGCFGGNDLPETDDDAAGLSDATMALHDAGFKDPYLDTEGTGDVKEFDIWEDRTPWNPHGDKEYETHLFTDDPDEPGAVPGPEIRVTQGDTVRVNLHIDGDSYGGHTMHWHGYDVPWASDGVPSVTQPLLKQEEEVFTYEFEAKQPGTYWYHCVVNFPIHLEQGMFGAFIVEPQDPAADLPYDRDEVLFFHETDSQIYDAYRSEEAVVNGLPSNPVDQVDSTKNHARTYAEYVDFVIGAQTGEYRFAQGPRDYYPALSDRYKPHYDTFMVNGKSYPETEPVKIKEGETLRLRLINAGQLHKGIHLHGHHMLVTHNDGYPLPEPHWEDTLHLAPGERKDVYVQGTNPGIWSFHEHGGGHGMGSMSANDFAFPGGMKTVLVYEDFETDEVLPPSYDATAGELAAYAPSYEGGR